MQEQKRSNPGLFSAIFHLITSFVMGYLWIAYLAVMIAIAINHPELDAVLEINYYLIMISTVWFFIYSILMFFQQFSRKKWLTIVNLLVIIVDIVAFVLMLTMMKGETIEPMMAVMWLYPFVLLELMDFFL